MQFTADDFTRLAADLAAEHGPMAIGYARQAVVTFEAEGEKQRALFWLTLCFFLDDLAENRLDPDLPVTLH